MTDEAFIRLANDLQQDMCLGERRLLILGRFFFLSGFGLVNEAMLLRGLEVILNSV